MLAQSSTFKYLKYFMGVVVHERQHTTQTNAGPPTDRDRDRLSNTFETNTSKTNPDVADSAEGLLADQGYEDREFYANGPVEKGGIDGENGDADYACPGTNWNP